MSGPALPAVTVWRDEPADGPTNMAADECLAAEADRRGTLLVRLYRWSPTTVSLGAFQGIDQARAVADIRGVPLVRRPSGGGAIVHGSDITYAAAVPKSHPWGAVPQSLYDALHVAMAEVLAGFGVAARPYRAADAATAPAAAEPGFFCFDRRSAGDLVIDIRGPDGAADCKVMGSAQRRLAGVVLQHGSLLVRGNRDVAGKARHPGVAELVPTASLPDADHLASAWLRRIAGALGGAVHEESGSWSRGRAVDIASSAVRFREHRWTARR